MLYLMFFVKVILFSRLIANKLKRRMFDLKISNSLLRSNPDFCLKLMINGSKRLIYFGPGGHCFHFLTH